MVDPPLSVQRQVSVDRSRYIWMNPHCRLPSRCLALAGLLIVVLAIVSCAEAQLPLADGALVSKESLHTKTLVINHWATWCAPCRIEIPELNLLAESVDPDEVLVFGYGEDFHADQQLREDIADMGIEFPVFTQDPASVWGYGTSTLLPRTAIIAPGGEVQQVLLGPQTQDSLREAISSISAPK